MNNIKNKYKIWHDKTFLSDGPTDQRLLPKMYKLSIPQMAKFCCYSLLFMISSFLTLVFYENAYLTFNNLITFWQNSFIQNILFLGLFLFCFLPILICAFFSIYSYDKNVNINEKLTKIIFLTILSFSIFNSFELDSPVFKLGNSLYQIISGL